MNDFNAQLNRALIRYGADDAHNLLHQMQENPELQHPDAVHRKVAADALEEAHPERKAEADLLRSEHPIYFWHNQVFKRTAPSADDFIDGYHEAALWSSTDAEGRPLDGHPYHNHELDAKARTEMNQDAAHFYHSHQHLFGDAYPSQAGHDFWLSRNGHGAGFFDGEEHYGDNAAELQRLANQAGEYYLDADADSPHMTGYGGTSKHWGQPAGLYSSEGK